MKLQSNVKQTQGIEISPPNFGRVTDHRAESGEPQQKAKRNRFLSNTPEDNEKIVFLFHYKKL